MRDDLDRFYTKKSVAKRCIDLVLSQGFTYSSIIEPSAGSGAFSTQIEDCISFDLSPVSEGIQKKNWFEVSALDLPERESTLVIGNPPFGTRGSIAKKFIAHSIQGIDATTIAFILPKTFRKHTNQKVFPNDWRLVSILELEKDESNFDLFGEGEIYIPCDFFVWTREESILHGVDLRDTLSPLPAEIEFLPRGSEDSDFVINGNSGRLRDMSEVTNPKAEHYIKVRDGFNKDEVMEFVRNLKYDFYSSVNGGVSWINKQDIAKAFHKAKQ